MRRIDSCLPTAADHLALDASLFHALDAGTGDEILRFWESDQLAVVLGRSGRAESDVHLAACAAARVPVFERISGGGTVLLGPGCLCYSLLLSLHLRPELADIRASYQLILNRIIQALDVPGAAVRGISDITIGDRKISGNAQRRGRHALLHHGTILYAFDPQDMERFLTAPQKQPPYRNQRSHADFVTSIGLSRPQIEERLAQAWVA